MKLSLPDLILNESPSYSYKPMGGLDNLKTEVDSLENDISISFYHLVPEFTDDILTPMQNTRGSVLRFY